MGNNIIQLEIGYCLGECNEERPIVNRRHHLCDECNFKRLHNGRSRVDIQREKNPGGNTQIKRSSKENNVATYEGFTSAEIAGVNTTMEEDVAAGYSSPFESLKRSEIVEEIELTPYEKFKLEIQQRKDAKNRGKVERTNVAKAANKIRKSSNRDQTGIEEGDAKQVFEKLKSKYSIKAISGTKKYKTSSGELLSQVDINRRLAEVKDRLQFEREPFCAATGSSEFPLSWSHTISVARAKELGKAELIYDPGNLELEGYHERGSNPVAGHNIWEDGTWEQKSKLLNIGRKVAYIKLHDPEQYRKLPENLKNVH